MSLSFYRNIHKTTFIILIATALFVGIYIICAITRKDTVFPVSVPIDSITPNNSHLSVKKLGTINPSEAISIPDETSQPCCSINLPFDYRFNVDLHDKSNWTGLILWNPASAIFDLISWNGVPIAQIELTKDQIDYDPYFIPPQFNKSHLAIMDYETGSINIIDFFSQEAWKVQSNCTGAISFQSVSLGPMFLAYACNNDPSVYYFSTISKSPKHIQIKLPQPGKTVPDFQIIWLDDSVMFLDSSVTSLVCITHLEQQDTTCKSFPFWLGSIDSDETSIEIRDTPNIPGKIGTLPFECITDNKQCLPSWIELKQLNLYIENSCQLIWGSGVWFSDNTKFIFITTKNPIPEVCETDHNNSDIWAFDPIKLSITHLAVLSSGNPVFRAFHEAGDVNFPIWQYEMGFLIIDDLFYDQPHPLLLLDIKSGSIHTLVEDKGSVIGIFDVSMKNP